jgi:hypothetical protein
MQPMHPWLAGELTAARTDHWRQQAAADQVRRTAGDRTRRPRRPWSGWVLRSPIVRRSAPNHGVAHQAALIR